jgi:cytochrome P450
LTIIEHIGKGYPAMQQFPIGERVQMAAMGINPYPTFSQMLQHEPVSWIPEIGMWYVTRRDDVLRILADTDTFTVASDESPMRQALGYNMLTTDGDEQTRLRRPFATAFAPRGLRGDAIPFIERLAQQLIDSFADKSVIDLKAEFADIIAIQTVIKILGLSVEDYAEIRRWVSDFASIMSNFTGDEGIVERGKQSVREFSDYVLHHINILRQSPNETVLGRMVQSENQLSDAEMIDAVRVIIFGGVETTSALIVNALWCLLNHPQQLQEIRANLDLLPNAIEEALRYESPVQTCTRHVLLPTEVCGVMLDVGDTLQCMLGAANRDQSHFQDADTFNIHRDNARDHLAFANGKHFCIGAGLARMEAEVSIRILLECFPKLSLAFPEQDVPHGYEFRSPHQLRVVCE